MSNSIKTKPYRQRLQEEVIKYSSEDQDHFLECWHNTNWGHYVMEFNGKYFVYKNWSGFVDKRNYFIEKYNLQEENLQEEAEEKTV